MKHSPSNSGSFFAKPLAATAAALLGSLLLWGCGGMGFGHSFGEKRLDLLTDFTIAVQGRNFKKALDMMAPREREKFVDTDGDIQPQFEQKLEDLEPARMNRQPFIRTDDGKISGLFEVLMATDGATEGGAGSPGFATRHDSAAAVSQKPGSYSTKM